MENRSITELREYRHQFTPRLSLADVAEKLGVKPATVSRWERGKRAPDRHSIRKISELTGVAEAQIAGYAA